MKRTSGASTSMRSGRRDRGGRHRRRRTLLPRLPPTRFPQEWQTATLDPLTPEQRRARREAARKRVVRQRRLVALGVLVLVIAAATFAITRGGSGGATGVDAAGWPGPPEGA